MADKAKTPAQKLKDAVDAAEAKRKAYAETRRAVAIDGLIDSMTAIRTGAAYDHISRDGQRVTVPHQTFRVQTSTLIAAHESLGDNMPAAFTSSDNQYCIRADRTSQHIHRDLIAELWKRLGGDE